MEREKQKTILLVEDEVLIAMAEKMTLEKFGYRVLAVHRGKDAVTTVAKTPGIDLILMDIDLGKGLDGTEAAALILKDRDLPVVFLSSHTEPEVVAKTEKITSYGYVVKDSSITVLDASIKMAFKLFSAKIKEKKKEEALRESEAKLDLALRSSNMGVWQWDIVANRRIFDNQVCHLLGLNPKTFKGTIGEFLAAVHPDDHEKIKAALERVVDQDGLYNPEYRAVWPDGSIHYINARGRLARDEAGRPLRINGIIWEISERKQAEEELKKSKLLLQSSIESPKDMIILSIDKQYRYLYFNTFHKNVMAAAYGKDVELGMNLLECITNDDDRTKSKMNYDRALAGESHSTIEEYGDLNRYYYETRYNPIINDKNEVIGATAFSADVSERKQAEKALRQSEERFRTLYENSTMGLYRTTPEGRVQLANPALVKMLGYTSFADLAARNLEQGGYAPSYDRARFIENIEKDSEVKGMEYAWKRNDGTTIIVRESARAIRDARGKTLFYDGIVEDITESKRSEKLTATLFGISQAMFTSGDLEELFPRIHALIGDIVPAVNFFIALLTDDGKSLSFPYYRDEKNDDKDVVIAADDSRSLTVEVLRTKKPLLLPEAQLQERYASGRNRLWGTAPKCWLGVPLRIRDEVIGVMVIQDYNDGQAYGQRDVALLESTAGQTAIAIARKRTEKALHKSVEAFKGYFNMGTVGMCVTSLEKGWIEVNDCLCRMLGYAREELVRLTWDEMTHADDLNIDLDLFKQVLAGRRDAYELDKRFIRKDGQVLYTHLYATCQRNPDGSIQQMLASLVDISERKRAEEEIRRQLAEKQILLREVHHRIKNNIAAISSLLSLRMKSLNNPEAVAVLQDAIGRVDSMRILYDKLLLDEAYTQASVKNYVESLIDMIVALFPGGAAIALNKHIADFQLDPKRLFLLGIIINELLTNIMKYAFAGRDAGQITFALASANGRVSLTLQDDGVGLPAGFDSEGSGGFGLMLVRMLCQQLGGIFSITAQAGTRCRIEFHV